MYGVRRVLLQLTVVCSQQEGTESILGPHSALGPSSDCPPEFCSGGYISVVLGFMFFSF